MQQSQSRNHSSIPLKAIGLSYSAAGAVWFILQSVRGWRGLPLGHYMFNVAATRVLLSGSHDIYNPAAQQAAANAYLGTHLPQQIETFIHPPQAAWLLLPLAHLNPYVGFAIFLVVSLGCVGSACWLLYTRVLSPTQPPATRAIVVLACVCTVPASWGIWYGEWDPLLLLPAVAATACAMKKRNLSAGLLLSLMFLKPNLIWLVPVVLVGARQWRMVSGLALGGAVWLATTPLILGFDHIGDWLSALHSNWDATLFSLGVPGMISSITQSQSVSFWCSLVLACLCIVLAVRFGERLGGRADLAIAIGIAASIAATPYAFRYDLILLAVPLCVWARSQPFAAIVTAIFISAMELVNERLILYDKNFEVLAPLAILAGLAITVRPGHLSLDHASGSNAKPA